MDGKIVRVARGLVSPTSASFITGKSGSFRILDTRSFHILPS